MNNRNYEDFINKYNDELIPRIKETLLSIKPGYKYVIRVESTKTKEFWVSSTNNPEQRMQTLKYLSLDETKWNSSYTLNEAKIAYKRMITTHGWT